MSRKNKLDLDFDAFIREADQYLNKKSSVEVIQKAEPKSQIEKVDTDEVQENSLFPKDLIFLRNQLKSLNFPEIGLAEFSPEEHKKFVNFCNFLIKRGASDSKIKTDFRIKCEKSEAALSFLESKCSTYENTVSELQTKLKKLEKMKIDIKESESKEK